MSAKRIAIINHSPRRQRGAALLIMLVILILGITTILVNSLTSSTVNTARQANTAAALAQAKDALIGYAITYGDTHSGQMPGYLPCPDPNGNAGVNGEGSSETCGNKDVSAIGRLPWRTLGLPTLRDGDGECLWYAVSGTYKNNPMTNMMNWDTGGLLSISVAGVNTISDVVAVIFAPGATLSGQNQNRSPDGTAPVCGGNYTVTNYLDNDTVHGINNANIATGKFIQGTSSVNDQMIYITRQDIWNAMLKRSDFMTTLTDMTRQVASCIAWYGSNNSNNDNYSLPWPAPLSLSDYTVDSNYNDYNGSYYGNLYAGRVPYKVDNSDSTSHNQMYGSYLLPTSPYSSWWGGASTCPGWSTTYYAWWSNWKDHLFYAISKEYRPIYYDSDTNNCGTCVQVSGHKYAAVVMFAGQALTGKSRSDKGLLSAYLEGYNYSNYPNSGGYSYYGPDTSGDPYNDVLFCIKEPNHHILSVVPYDTAQGKCP